MSAVATPLALVTTRGHTASTAHRRDVQGLRAVAVLLVALAHAGVGVFAGGFVGVDVFFVLSGFLITGLLLAEARKTGCVSLLDFYIRRARRILPAAALTLVVTDLASLYVMNFVRARSVVLDGAHAGAFAANFRFAARGVDYFAQTDPPSPFLHYWSLSVEEQFYVFWPPLLVTVLFALRGRGGSTQRRHMLLLVILLLTASSLGWSLHETTTVPAAAYFSPFTRSWELGLGAALAVASSTLACVPPAAKSILGWAGLTAIAAAAVSYSAATPYPGTAALLPALGAALAIVGGIDHVSSSVSATRVLAAWPLGLVGDRSYAFYLWHWPMLVLGAAYAGHALPVATKLGLLTLAFLLSCVTYALVENPLRKMKSRRGTAIVAALCTAGVLVTAAASLAALDREQHRFEGPGGASPVFSAVSYRTVGRAGALPAVVAAVEAARRGEPIPKGLTPPIGALRSFPPPYMPPAGCIARDRDPVATARACRVGRAASSKLIVLLGDSHALMWLPSVLELAWRDNWSIVPLLRLGCTPGRWPKTGTNCGAWYRWALAQVARLHPRVVLVGGSIDQADTPETRAAVSGILAAARVLEHSGRVAVVGDPEGLSKDPVDCLLGRDASMATCTTTWTARALTGYDSVARGAKHLGVGFVATRGLVCFERQCPTVIGNTIAWMDTNHLTVAYAAQVAGAFRTAFLAATKRP